MKVERRRRSRHDVQARLDGEPLLEPLGFTATGPELRITRRCCTDDLNEPHHGTVDDLRARHAVVDKFRTMRSQRPTGMEKMRALPSRLDLYNLHSGRT